MCAFLRAESRDILNKESHDILRFPKEAASDIFSALRVLARRNVTTKEVIMDLHGAKVSWFDFGEGNFENVNFLKAELLSSNLNGVNLSNATLSGANLERSRFFGANLTGAKLAFTVFSMSEGFTEEQLAQAKTLYAAKLGTELDQALRDYLGEEKYKKLVLDPPNEEN